MQALAQSKQGKDPASYMPWLREPRQLRPLKDLVADMPMLFPGKKV